MLLPIQGHLSCQLYGYGDSEECLKAEGLSFYDPATDTLHEPLPYRDGSPLCHDPLFETGYLGSVCFDEADLDDEDTSANNETDDAFQEDLNSGQ
jgi:hypothetical protein